MKTSQEEPIKPLYYYNPPPAAQQRLCTPTATQTNTSFRATRDLNITFNTHTMCCDDISATVAAVTPHLLVGNGLASEECTAGDQEEEERSQAGLWESRKNKKEKTISRADLEKGCCFFFKWCVCVCARTRAGFVCASLSIWMRGLHNMRSDWLLPSTIASMDASQWIRGEHWKAALRAGWVLSPSLGGHIDISLKWIQWKQKEGEARTFILEGRRGKQGLKGIKLKQNKQSYKMQAHFLQKHSLSDSFVVVFPHILSHYNHKTSLCL